jgi:hypothetical protein
MAAKTTIAQANRLHGKDLIRVVYISSFGAIGSLSHTANEQLLHKQFVRIGALYCKCDDIVRDL